VLLCSSRFSNLVGLSESLLSFDSSDFILRPATVLGIFFDGSYLGLLLKPLILMGLFNYHSEEGASPLGAGLDFTRLGVVPTGLLPKYLT